MTPFVDLDSEKRQAALKATEFVHDGMVVGLGTGTTSKHLIVALGERVRAGLKIQAVPTSHDTAALAKQSGIPLIESDNAWMIDVAIDGADQVDPALNLVKGGGGALLKEKIVAAAAKRFIVMVDHTKLVPALGGSFPCPLKSCPSDGAAPHGTLRKSQGARPCCGSATARCFRPKPVTSFSICTCRTSMTRPPLKSHSIRFPVSLKPACSSDGPAS